MGFQHRLALLQLHSGLNFSLILSVLKAASLKDFSYIILHCFSKDSSSGNTHQMWYDDPESLGLKYQYAVDNDLRGVGMWTANFLDYTDTPEGEKQRSEMWGALPVYK